jgi:hypothetical protein
MRIHNAYKIHVCGRITIDNGAVYFTADVCPHRVPPLEEAAMAAMQNPEAPLPATSQAKGPASSRGRSALSSQLSAVSTKRR